MDTQIRFKSAPPATLDISPAGLNALGFVSTTYPGQEGTYFAAKVTVGDMPYLAKQVDDDVIYADSVVTVELTPDGGVQMVIYDTGYSEQYGDAFSAEGLGLLNDILAALASRRDLGATILQGLRTVLSENLRTADGAGQ